MDEPNAPAPFLEFNQLVLELCEEEDKDATAASSKKNFHPILQENRRADRRARFEAAATRLLKFVSDNGISFDEAEAKIEKVAQSLQQLMAEDWWQRLRRDDSQAAVVEFRAAWDRCQEARQAVFRLHVKNSTPPPTNHPQIAATEYPQKADLLPASHKSPFPEAIFGGDGPNFEEMATERLLPKYENLWVEFFDVGLRLVDDENGRNVRLAEEWFQKYPSLFLHVQREVQKHSAPQDTLDRLILSLEDNNRRAAVVLVEFAKAQGLDGISIGMSARFCRECCRSGAFDHVTLMPYDIGSDWPDCLRVANVPISDEDRRHVELASVLMDQMFHGMSYRDGKIVKLTHRFSSLEQDRGLAQPRDRDSPSDVADPRSLRPKIKEPSKEAIASYRLWMAVGGKQTDLARMLSQELGRHVSQGQFSKWRKQVKGWLEAGNVLPTLENASRSKTISMDPAKIELGERLDGRTPRQRPNAETDDEE